ncbi:MAG: helix-hairpin-helix domain-containing protein [bacterium]
MAKDFWNIGIRHIEDFKDKHPDQLYAQICQNYGCYVDRCMLYVCRCCVYFAENKIHDPEKLKRRNWKDTK